MNKKQALTGTGASIGLLILILDGRTALSGAQAGVDLCIKTVIPSLFPFFLLSIWMTGSFRGSSLSVFVPMRKLLHIPAGAESILLSGFLGGYPAGAQSVGAAYSSGLLSRNAADRMMAFCNNAGPACIFGMVSSVFPNRNAAWELWVIHIGSAVLTAQFLPAVSSENTSGIRAKPVTLSESMHSAIRVMSSVCVWVVVFRVVLSFLERWLLWLLPVTAQVVIAGLLELSNGCCELPKIADCDLRFVVCSGMLAWGGLCVSLQTQSVSSGLSMKNYLKGKLIQTLFSLLLSASVVLHIWLPVLALLLFLSGILRKTQNRGRNPAAVGV